MTKNKKSKRIIATTGKGKDKHTYSECQQKQCGFYQNGGCKICEECGAKPKMVDDKCKTCFDCEYKPGKLRWGNDNSQPTQTITNDIKDKTKLEKEKSKLWEGFLKTLNNSIKEKGLVVTNDGKVLMANSGENNGEIKEEMMKRINNQIKEELVRQMSEMILAKSGIFNEENKDGEKKKKEVTYIG